MDRRTFLKAVAITTVGMPTLASTKKEPEWSEPCTPDFFKCLLEEPKWIKATDRLPIVGQRIIQLSNNPMYRGDYNLLIGTYYQDNTRMYAGQVKFSIKQEYRFSNVFSRVRWNYPGTNDEEVRELEWMKAEEVRNVPYSTNCSFNIKHLYWMSIEYLYRMTGDKLPKKLPPFPKLVE